MQKPLERSETQELLIKLKKRRNRKNTLSAYAFLSPWIIGFILFSGIPIIAAFVISAYDWSMVDIPSFIGLDNYKEMFAPGSSFWNSLKVTILFMLGYVVLTVSWSFMMAFLLNLKMRPIGFFQFIYFIPAVLPSVALAFVFQLIYNREIGVLNYFLSLFGVKNGPNWLFDSSLVLPAVILVFIFTYSTGQMMLIFRSGLNDVPKELYEACDIDGGNALQKFWYVTIPAISPVLLFNLIMSCIGGLNGSFSVIFPLTGGGPGDATQVLGLSIYISAFRNYRMGYASALAMALFFLSLAFSLGQFWLSKKWVHYEN